MSNHEWPTDGAKINSMEALRTAKRERYVKATASKGWRCNDDIANALDDVPPSKVIRAVLDLLGIDENPYAHLNVGQQSMTLRNKLRSAWKAGKITVAEIRQHVESNGYVLSAEERARKKPRK